MNAPEQDPRVEVLEEWAKALEEYLAVGGAPPATPAEVIANIDDARRTTGREGGAELIRQERARQVAKGYDAAHDDGHADGMILNVADEIIAHLNPYVITHGVDPWGLIASHTKKGSGELRLLVIAGALVAAEIDRRLRERALAGKEADDGE